MGATAPVDAAPRAIWELADMPAWFPFVRWLPPPTRLISLRKSTATSTHIHISRLNAKASFA